MNNATQGQIVNTDSLPKVTTTERLNLTGAAAGRAVIVWDSTLSKVCVHDGSAWYILTTTSE